MNKRYIIGIAIIAIFLVVGFFAFVDTKVEYSNFQHASSTHKKCQVKGSWLKEKETRYDPTSNQFVFYMKDENNTEMKVVLDGAEPNNFKMAENIVAKGKVKDGQFYASEVLTKCPSKYEGDGEDVKKSSM
ncbi:MAG: cytochrome c maturation protein CcmE [Chlorobi bacterium]|nr:cytochrome c maturation protein CcmE [Chlorobiota bacterium]MCI0715225.1 cytochrome c maturation protein CcmE [Chlorobiota bacterium]